MVADGDPPVGTVTRVTRLPIADWAVSRQLHEVSPGESFPNEYASPAENLGVKLSDRNRDHLIDRRSLLAVGLAGAATLGAPVAAHASGTELPLAWRDAETVPLWSGAPPATGFVSKSTSSQLRPGLLWNIATPELKVFRPRAPNGRALLTIPGGGYIAVSVLNEGLEVAQRMTAAGYTVFVLVYRLPAEGWSGRADVPLQDAQRAMRVIRSRAGLYGFDQKKVALVGFSAGGHLGASLATGYAEEVYAPRDQVDQLDARPLAAGLIYPVIALDGPYAHRGSAALLLGPNPSSELFARRNPAKHVTPNTPPVFLVHALDDTSVPMQNSWLMLDAMKSAGRSAEAHFLPTGGHGFGLGKAGERTGEWPGLFTSWLDQEVLRDA